MVFDSESDKKMVKHVIDNFQISGVYEKARRAIAELDGLSSRVARATIVAPNKSSVKEVKK